MGNYRFKLSDMMPNAWFYKLKDNMGGKTTRNQTSSTTRKKKQPSSQQNSTAITQSSKPKCNPRKSYYFTRELNHTSPADNNLNISETNFQQQPRKSSKQKPKKKKTPKTSFSSSLVYSSEEETEFPEPEIRTDRVLLQTVKFDEKISTCSGCNKLQNDSNNDIIINVDNNSLAKKDDVFDSLSKLMMLPPIVTKPEKFNDFLNDDAKKKEIKKGSLKVKIVNSEQRKNSNSRRFSVNSPGVKLKINSPRIGSRKLQLQLQGRKSVTGTGTGTGGYRRSISDSLAIVKSSVNPERDFRESMVEMIVQNNIRSSKDLEDLLACYLSLNSDEYHEIIIKVFKQIWFDLTDNQ